jgi:hypothetical protein
VEGKGIGARSLACNTLGVEGMLELRNGTRKNDKLFNYSHGPAQSKQQVDYYKVGALLMHEQATGKYGLIILTTT